jgi:hypothetical protein
MDDRASLADWSDSGAPRRRGRQWVRWIGWGALVLALALVGSCTTCVKVGQSAAAEGSAFFQDSVSALTEKWDPAVLEARAAPEFLQSMPPDNLRAFVAFVSSRLGRPMGCKTVRAGQWQVFLGTGGLTVFTTHDQECTFERGVVTISARLVRRADKWAIVAINFNGAPLMKTNAPESPSEDTRR